MFPMARHRHPLFAKSRNVVTTPVQRFREGAMPPPPPLLLRILQKIYEKNTKIDIQLLFPEPHFAEIGFWPSLSKISRSASDNVKILRE